MKNDRIRILFVGALILAGVGFGSLAYADDNIKLTTTIMDAQTRQTVSTINSQGNLQNLFQQQKEMVTTILNRLNIPVEGLPPAVRQALNQPHTQDVRAFVAFSVGLDHRDHGRLAEANAAFSQASQFDSSFAAASQAARATPIRTMSVTELTNTSMTRAKQQSERFLVSGNAAVLSPPAPRHTPHTAQATPPPATTNPGDMGRAIQAAHREVTQMTNQVRQMVNDIARNPNQAPQALQQAMARGVHPDIALEAALTTGGRNLPPNVAAQLLDNAMRGGVTVEGARQVVRNLRAGGGC